MITDKELMLKIINGDIDKIGLLYERYNKILFGYFFKMSRNKELSEDLVNDVFLKILHFKNKYRGDGIFRVWMFRIARSIFIDNYRKSKKIVLMEKVFISESLEPSINDSHQLYEIEENKMLLHKALLRLKKKEREVIVLAKLDELKYKEIAEILNCSEEAAKTRTFRALNNLKRLLGEILN